MLFEKIATAAAFVFAFCLQGASAATDCDKLYPPCPSGTNTTYPSKNEICNIFSKLEGSSADTVEFLEHLSPTVNWTIEGTHPAAGMYLNRTLFAGVLLRIGSVASAQHPFQLSIVNIIGGGSEEWSAQELHVYGICKNGLVFDNRYSWVTRWNHDGIIVQGRAYLDSALVGQAFAQNELGSLFTYSDLRNESVPYTVLTEEQLQRATGFEKAEL